MLDGSERICEDQENKIRLAGHPGTSHSISNAALQGGANVNFL